MGSDTGDKIDELANDLDELKTTVEEIAEDPPSPESTATLDRLKSALENAGDAADELEDGQES